MKIVNLTNLTNLGKQKNLLKLVILVNISNHLKVNPVNLLLLFVF